ncbi:acetolactate synthase [Acaromyces ingoldii]|uniref:Acetolactate synthase n=1 Tax=Acaromyces ingoldii TaxID=215250 RepID=A0A316YT08_9BASI|nr:acetolactate synthase [Acaromyces ingoldii]PWN92429.1 acetolactate synthase [Acaromyces ingoldii]
MMNTLGRAIRPALRGGSEALTTASRRHMSASSTLLKSGTPKTDNHRDDGPGARSNDSTSALDYKLSHRLRKLPPLPSLEPPTMDASEAVSNILYNTPAPSKQPFKRHILNTLVQNEPGVLSRVSGTLAARGFNIDSLVVCATEIRDLSRMCIVLRGQDGVVEQARRQLEDLVPVWAVLDYTQNHVIERELMLVKVSILGPEYFEESQYGLSGPAAQQTNQHIPPELLAERRQGSQSGLQRPPAPQDPATDAAAAVGQQAASVNVHAAPAMSPTEALRVKSDNMRSVIALAEQFQGRVVDVSSTSVIVEISAKSSRCDAFLKLVRPFGLLECARSGTMVLPRSPITSSWTGNDDLTEEEAAEVDASLLPPG